MSINLRATAPLSEFSRPFLQGMIDRMGTSFYKYGAAKDNYPSPKDALANVRLRVRQYEKTGNTEFLIDAANFLMLEFMHPSHPEAHYRATSSDEAPPLV